MNTFKSSIAKSIAGRGIAGIIKLALKTGYSLIDLRGVDLWWFSGYLATISRGSEVVSIAYDSSQFWIVDVENDQWQIAGDVFQVIGYLASL